MMKIYAIHLTLVVLLGGCSTYNEGSYLEKPETSLGTGSESNKIMHSAVDFPRGISLAVPGYIVGLEKVPRSAAGKKIVSDKWSISPRKEGRLHQRIPTDEARTQKIADKLFENRKAHIVSHILEYDAVGDGISTTTRIKGCTLYSLYGVENGGVDFSCATKKYNHQSTSSRENYNTFEASWDALKKLDDSIASKFNIETTPGPTHILVYLMGWNTPQEQAIRNFNSLAGHLIDAAEADGKVFRPLVIGVSWASLWKNVPFIPSFISQPSSYINKANDADEVGMSWLGVLLHDILPKYRQEDKNGVVETPVIVVGHSFGARAVSRAVFTGPAITKPDSSVPTNNHNVVVDLMISLQGAYSINRFTVGQDKRTGRENYPYDRFGRQAGKVLLTSSDKDTAVDIGFWSRVAGDDKSWREECGSKEDTVESIYDCETIVVKKGEKPEDGIRSSFAKIKSAGCRPKEKNDCKILYLNTDSIIRYNTAGTGGGAHSDIYRSTIGVLTWEAIKKYAPKTSKGMPTS